MSEQRAFRGVWIPAEIWLSRDLSLQEKVMLVEIDSLQAGERGCYKSNKKFAEFFQLSPSRVSEIISGLAKKGWLRIEQVRNGKQVIERRLFIAKPLSAPEEGIRNPEGGIRNPEGGYSENAANPIRNPEGGYSENAEERGSGLRGSVEGVSLSGAGKSEPPTDPADLDPRHPAEAPSVFDRAAELDDQGQPLDVDVTVTPHPHQSTTTAGRKAPMTLEWEPDLATWQRACFDRGLPVDADVSIALIDFREHYAAQPGRTHTPADWTRRFAKWVHQNLQRQAARSSQSPAATGGDHANRRQRTPARRLTAAEARARDRAARESGAGAVYEGEHHPPGH